MADIMTPTLGESVTEATVARWTKKAGDAVRKDEILVELETDKVSLEVASPSDGVLSEIAAEEGATVEPGAVLGKVSEGAAAPAPKKANGAKPAEAPPAPAPKAEAKPERKPEPKPAPAPAPARAEPVMAPSAQRVVWRAGSTPRRSKARARTDGSPRAMRWPRWRRAARPRRRPRPPPRRAKCTSARSGCG